MPARGKDFGFGFLPSGLAWSADESFVDLGTPDRRGIFGQGVDSWL
jgi:hypothetical protein